MRSTIHTLGWYMRRVPEPEALVRFYNEVLGLPILRWYGRSAMLYAGETQTFEVNLGGTTPPAYTDRSQASCTPIFRVHGIHATIERLKAAGVQFINEFERDYNTLAYFIDPAGHITGLQERHKTSPREEDQEAWRRWDAGEVGFDGAPALPPDIQHINWVVIRVEDTQGMINWYRDVLGLDEAVRYPGNSLMSLGDGVLLEISPGAPPQPFVNDRSEVSNSFIIRVEDPDALINELRGKGAHIVNEPFDIVHGRIAYFQDPEGHLVGVQRRADTSDRIEDVEFRKRFQK